MKQRWNKQSRVGAAAGSASWMGAVRKVGAGGIRRRTSFRSLAAICCVLVAGPLLAATTTVPLDAGWSFRLDPDSVDASMHAELQQWMPALVPGSVQTSLLKLKKIRDPYWRITTPSIAWIGLSNWDYRKTFEVSPALQRQGHVELVFRGLDTFATVSLNGKPIIEADNMFRTWKANVGGLLRAGTNTLEVRFDSPIRKMIPIVERQPYILKSPNPIRFGLVTVPTAAYTRKAPYQYGWDWGPRVITEGIWQGVSLRAWDAARITGLHAIQKRVSAASAEIQTVFHVDTDVPIKARVVVHWIAPDGRVTTASQALDLTVGSHRVEVPVTIQHPELWWPAGYGAQPLYRFTAAVEGPDGARAQATTGVRSVELRQRPDQWGTSFEFVVNGVPVFAKGANFVPTSVFPSAVTPASLDDILRSAHAANMNMLRIWGGGYYMPSSFYAEADKLGILLWQDFEFSDAFQPPWKSYRDNVRVEARQQVRRLRNHPSLVLWSGNNEVGEMWTTGFGGPEKPSGIYTEMQQKELAAGMDRLYNGVLKNAVERYAPGTSYVPMWPVGDEQIVNTQSRGNYHYWSVWHGPGLPATAYLGVTPRFMSEYGLQSFPSLPTIDSFTLPADRSAYSKVMLWHEKSEEDGKSSVSTINRLFHYIERDYGKPADFDDAVYLSQVMQAEGIQLGAEHLRASAPRTMGSLFWQLDDDWPAISWSSIDYEHRWKMLQYHAKRFYAAVRVIALPSSSPAGTQSVALSVVNDTADVIHGTLRTLVMGLRGRVVRDVSVPVTVAARGVTRVGTDSTASLLGNANPASVVAVFELREGDRTISRHFFEFVPPKDLRWVDPGITAAVTPDGRSVDVSARNFAGEVWITFGAHKVRLANNAFDLLPGEHVRVPIVQADATSAALARSLHVESLYGPISREKGVVSTR